MSTPPRHTVLILEDEPILNRMMGIVLKQHAVSTAFTVDEAWALIEGGLQPDCILCDLRLAKLETGATLYLRLVEHRPALTARLVWMSGGLRPEDEVVVNQSGRPHVLKPISNDDLRALVLKVCQA